MKRLNPATGEPFRRGDTREDGKVFYQYKTSEPTNSEGLYREVWVSHDYLENTKKAQRDWQRANPDRSEDARLRHKYGITLEDRGRLFVNQGGRCWICERHERDTGTLCVDHCHDTGAVRGLLCSQCNKALGFLEQHNDPDAMATRMIKYRHQRPAQTVLTCGET